MGRFQQMLESLVHKAARLYQFDDVHFFLESGASLFHRNLLLSLGAANEFVRQKPEEKLLDVLSLRVRQRDRLRLE